MTVSTGSWTEIPEMEAERREHACLFVEFEDTKGILVTGGEHDGRGLGHGLVDDFLN